MTLESPPRLKHDPELGRVIRAGDDAALSAERLARNHDAVHALIAAPASRAWLWKVGLVALALAGAVLVAERLRGGAGAAPPAVPVVAVAPTASIDAGVAAAGAIDAGVETAPSPPPAASPPAAPPPPPVARPRRRAVAPPPPDPAPAPSSDLPEQIRLYEAARTAGREGEFATGIARIGELLGRFPATPLRAEAELTRAELYARAGRHGEAVAALEQLIASPAHAGRRGELLRTLGDLQRQHGDCARATEAYGRAQAERLSQRERDRVARGLAGCEP